MQCKILRENTGYGYDFECGKVFPDAKSIVDKAFELVMLNGGKKDPTVIVIDDHIINCPFFKLLIKAINSFNFHLGEAEKLNYELWHEDDYVLDESLVS